MGIKDRVLILKMQKNNYIFNENNLHEFCNPKINISLNFDNFIWFL